ncbi:MAG: 50S ribosomal protein L6 [Gammaproteobacteria bacterium]|nr:50S ribosomal protein L6 [Gammaproteobacteria bacterium]
MSRVAKAPVELPAGVEASYKDNQLTIKGSKGSLTQNIHPLVNVTTEDNQVRFAPAQEDSWPMAGTMRSLVNNMVVGVTEGFEKNLELIGVGYRAKASGNKLDLSLGFSHPVVYEVPQGITVETPKNTKIVIKGIDKQQVGQAAAKIRSYRPPEPYKGKGVRYADERVVRKEAKKK